MRASCPPPSEWLQRQQPHALRRSPRLQQAMPCSACQGLLTYFAHIIQHLLSQKFREPTWERRGGKLPVRRVAIEGHSGTTREQPSKRGHEHFRHGGLETVILHDMVQVANLRIIKRKIGKPNFIESRYPGHQNA